MGGLFFIFLTFWQNYESEKMRPDVMWHAMRWGLYAPLLVNHWRDSIVLLHIERPYVAAVHGRVILEFSQFGQILKLWKLHIGVLWHAIRWSLYAPLLSNLICFFTTSKFTNFWRGTQSVSLTITLFRLGDSTAVLREGQKCYSN